VAHCLLHLRLQHKQLLKFHLLHTQPLTLGRPCLVLLLLLVVVLQRCHTADCVWSRHRLCCCCRRLLLLLALLLQEAAMLP
jgi:hypothetical protein